MEILSPAASSCWLFEETGKSFAKWTAAENKAFENALALYDKDTPDRWRKVAAMVPGKTVSDVMRQYKELEDDISSIEAGLMDLIPFPATSPFTLEWGCGGGGGFDPRKQCFGKRPPPGSRLPEHERKKGIPWTEEEHKLFLMGLKKYGKGDWRNISRNFVITRTPTQVASHAQKYFIRQLSGGKDKRRASIHDITTVNLVDNQSLSPDKNSSGTSDQQGALKMPFQWDHHQGLGSFAQGNSIVSSYGVDSFGTMHKRAANAFQESFFGSQLAPFQIQSAAPRYYRA